jgi:phage-related protein
MKKRELFFYRDYFKDFYLRLNQKTQKKVLWTLKVIEYADRIPEVYFKHLEDTDGLYEIRILFGGNIFRVICFFDNDNIIVIGHGFQKKTQKIPPGEIEKAQRIKKEYCEEKKSHKP